MTATDRVPVAARAGALRRAGDRGLRPGHALRRRDLHLFGDLHLDAGADLYRHARRAPAIGAPSAAGGSAAAGRSSLTVTGAAGIYDGLRSGAASDRRLRQRRLSLRRHVASRLDPGAAVRRPGVAGAELGASLTPRTISHLVFAEADAARTAARRARDSTSFPLPEALRAALSRGADRPRCDADRRGGAHLQHSGRRKPPGRGGADRRGVSAAAVMPGRAKREPGTHEYRWFRRVRTCPALF